MNHEPTTALVLAPALSARGGAERVAVYIASCLRAHGRRVILAYPGEEVSLDEVGRYFDVDLNGVQALVLPSQPRALGGLEELRMFVEQRAWRRRLLALEPDLFFNCMTGSEMPALGRRSFYYVHFPHEIRSTGLRGAKDVYVRLSRVARALAFTRGKSFLNGYVLLANSAFTAHHVDARWRREAQVLYPPVPDFGPGHASRNPWILTAGRFQDRKAGHPHKRQDALITAFADMPDLHAAGWQLHVAGSVGSLAELDRLTRLAEGLPVVFHPDASREALAELYRSSTLYWHAQGFGEPEEARPEAQEHFGLTVGEALTAGLLPLVYDTAGPAEIVSGLPMRSTWRTMEDLLDLTRSKHGLSEHEVGQERAAILARSAEFSELVFRGRLTALVEGVTV